MDGDPSWALDPETVLEFPPAGLQVDLRSPLPASVVAQLVALGVGGHFAVVTPCDPRGIRAAGGDNATEVSALRASLKLRGCRFVPADGLSPDGGHRESGFAVDLPLEDAVTLARSLEQSALFWFDGEVLSVAPVLVAGETVRLPRGGRAVPQPRGGIRPPRGTGQS